VFSLSKVMKFKLWRRRMSVSAPRMTVRTHVPWPMRAAGLIALLAVSGALALWIYDAGRHFAGFSGVDSAELERLRKQLVEVTSERDRLVAAGNSIESRMSIERSAQQQLANQVRALEIDNARLKEDLAFFDGIANKGEASGVAIKRLTVEPDDVPRQMRYRILVTQGGKQTRDFTGTLQLILTLQQGGKAVIINLPDSDPRADRKVFQVNFRRYQRLEGSLTIPEGATLKQVQARVLEGSMVRAQQSLLLK